MRPIVRTVFAVLCGVLPFAGVVELGAQASKRPAPGAPTPACALLTVAEVRQLTGRPDYPDFVDGDPLGEGLGGGSSCQYGGAGFGPGAHAPLLSVVLIPRTRGKPAPEFQRGLKLGEGCARESVSGIGDDAVIESCPKARGPVVYVAIGKNDLLVQVDAKPVTAAWAKAAILAVAKAAAAGVR